MLQLRYAGCSDCLSTAKSLLRNAGLLVNRDYTVEYHQDHKADRIYQKRPDYLKVTSGAIIYNPKSEAWIDIYSADRMHCDACDMPTQSFAKLVHDLSTMS